MQCNDKTPIRVRNTVVDKGQRQVVYDPASNLFLLVMKEKEILVVILLPSTEPTPLTWSKYQ